MIKNDGEIRQAMAQTIQGGDTGKALDRGGELQIKGNELILPDGRKFRFTDLGNGTFGIAHEGFLKNTYQLNDLSRESLNSVLVGKMDEVPLQMQVTGKSVMSAEETRYKDYIYNERLDSLALSKQPATLPTSVPTTLPAAIEPASSVAPSTLSSPGPTAAQSAATPPVIPEDTPVAASPTTTELTSRNMDRMAERMAYESRQRQHSEQQRRLQQQIQGGASVDTNSASAQTSAGDMSEVTMGCQIPTVTPIVPAAPTTRPVAVVPDNNGMSLQTSFTSATQSVATQPAAAGAIDQQARSMGTHE